MLQALDSNQRATLGYIAPFIAFVGVMALERVVPLPPQWLYPVRFLIVATLIATFSWPYLSFRPSAPLASIAVGIGVFLIWIAPDVLFGYRHHWLFEIRSRVGQQFAAPHLKKNLAFILTRTAGAGPPGAGCSRNSSGGAG